MRPTEDGASQKVKVKVRVNPNGIFGVSSASLVEKHEIEEEVPEEMENGEVKMVKKKKTVNKTVELPVSQRVNGQLSYDRLQAAVRYLVCQSQCQ